MIIAVDPGKMCGVFWFDGKTHGGIERDAYHALLAVETRFLGDTWRSADTVCVVERWDTVANAGRMSRQHDALEVVGTLRYLCRKEGIEFIEQGRADRLRVTDEMFTLLDWNVMSPQGHVREAARHALLQFAVRYSQHPTVARLVGMMNGEVNEGND
jgi:hypothetical protein